METPQSFRTLGKLREDHRTFSVLLDAVALQLELAESGRQPDIQLLAAICAYFEDYPTNNHHPSEELIYGHLICQYPHDSDGVLNLLDDHHSLRHRTQTFRHAVDSLNTSKTGRDTFIREAKLFLTSQRDHIQVEEQSFFPHAERYLTPQQWKEVDLGLYGLCDPTSQRPLPAVFEPLAELLPCPQDLTRMKRRDQPIR